MPSLTERFMDSSSTILQSTPTSNLPRQGDSIYWWKLLHNSLQSVGLRAQTLCMLSITQYLTAFKDVLPDQKLHTQGKAKFPVLYRSQAKHIEHHRLSGKHTAEAVQRA